MHRVLPLLLLGVMPALAVTPASAALPAGAALPSPMALPPPLPAPQDKPFPGQIELAVDATNASQHIIQTMSSPP